MSDSNNLLSTAALVVAGFALVVGLGIGYLIGGSGKTGATWQEHNACFEYLATAGTGKLAAAMIPVCHDLRNELLGEDRSDRSN